MIRIILVCLIVFFICSESFSQQSYKSSNEKLKDSKEITSQIFIKFEKFGEISFMSGNEKITEKVVYLQLYNNTNSAISVSGTYFIGVEGTFMQPDRVAKFEEISSCNGTVLGLQDGTSFDVAYHV